MQSLQYIWSVGGAALRHFLRSCSVSFFQDDISITRVPNCYFLKICSMALQFGHLVPGSSSSLYPCTYFNSLVFATLWNLRFANGIKCLWIFGGLRVHWKQSRKPFDIWWDRYVLHKGNIFIEQLRLTRKAISANVSVLEKQLHLDSLKASSLHNLLVL